MPPNVKAPAEVLADQDEGRENRNTSPDQSIQRRSKRKAGNSWSEDRGRYLYRYGPNGYTVFDTWIWFGDLFGGAYDQLAQSIPQVRLRRGVQT
jgi:hypothetical protein